MLKLQVKDSGAWRNIIEFAGEHLADATELGARLLRISNGNKITFRIAQGDQVLGYCEKPLCEWEMRK